MGLTKEKSVYMGLTKKSTYMWSSGVVVRVYLEKHFFKRFSKTMCYSQIIRDQEILQKRGMVKLIPS